MDILSSSRKRIDESNMELYRARFAGKLCIAFVCAVQYLPRSLIVARVAALKHKLEINNIISFVILALMIFLILAEYIIFKKIGPRIVKYTNLLDITLLILYTMDWVLILMSSLRAMRHTVPPSFELMAFYGFTMFAWRALLVTLIVQKWWLKMIPPSVATIVAGVYGIIYLPNDLFGCLVKSGFQLFNVIIILYCEDKIQWKMIWSSLQKDKWIQVNNFILNNIPENIMILDFAGKTRFVSDYCKSFLKKCHIEDDGGNTGDLFGRIRDLHEQSELEEIGNNPEITVIQMERLTSHHDLFAETNENNSSAIKIDILEDLVRNFRQIIAEKNLQERQFLIFNGKMRPENSQQDKSIEIKISFVHNVDNEYIILILRDTTQRDLLVRLEENNKYKDQLLASVSHELRAPLNGNINLIEGAVNSLIIPEDLKESLLIPALRSGKFLLHIINDILDMSQIKEKKLRLVFQPGDLQETLKSAAQLVELQAKKKGIELEIELDANLPEQFCTDYMRLSQIILNLLSNAIKFTRQGVVKLTALPINEEEGNWVKITVEDSGIGISRGNLHKLFSSYTNIEFEERQTLNPAGAGLGLSIASNLADLLAPKGHPGISVTSVPNQGSIFSFIIEDKKEILNGRQLEKPIPLELDLEHSCEIADELPRKISLPQLQKTGTSTSMTPLINGRLESETILGETQCSCAKILIVDDNPFNTMAFETILNSLNIQCDSVYSGSAAIEKLLNRQIKTCRENCQPYSVVFMDQEMPEMTGSETVEEIKRLQRENLVPYMKIIGCTAHKAKEEVERFMESGLDSCIFKPISVVMIRDILKKILKENE